MDEIKKWEQQRQKLEYWFDFLIGLILILGSFCIFVGAVNESSTAFFVFLTFGASAWTVLGLAFFQKFLRAKRKYHESN